MKKIKKLGVYMLACMMLMSLIPAINVHAASNAITLSTNEITIKPGTEYNTVVASSPDDSVWEVWCSTSGDTNAFAETNNFFALTEDAPRITTKMSNIMIDPVSGLEDGDYEMLVTIYGKNRNTSASYEPVTLKISMTVGLHNVKVTNGTGGGELKKGDTVTITADTPETGKQFKEWKVVSGDVTLADSKNATTTFTMPDKDVEVTATYEDITATKYKVTVNNGSSDKTEYEEGDTVTITANAPEKGMLFSNWSTEASDIRFENYGTNATTTFIMPNSDVEVSANYVPMTLELLYYFENPDFPKERESITLAVGESFEAKSFEGYDLSNVSVGIAGAKIQVDGNKITLLSYDFDGINTSQIILRYTKQGTTPSTPENPTITAGAGSTHQIKAGKDMTLTCSGKLEDLTGIYVDGNLLDAGNYTLTSGSTVLTLKASYLDTLSAGKHTLKFQYKDNLSAETEFSITTNTAKTSPKTGDTSNTMFYVGLIALSGCVAGFGLKKKKCVNK